MSADRLSQAFSALSDPTRRAILARLASGDASVNELVEPFNLSQPAISKHLKVLENAGLISRGRVAQSRPCHLEVEPLKSVADWIEQHAPGDAAAALVAHHWERGGDLRAAAAAYDRASTYAASVGEAAEAMRHFTRARELRDESEMDEPLAPGA